MLNCLRISSCLLRTGPNGFSKFAAFKPLAPSRSFVSGTLLVKSGSPPGGGILLRDATKSSGGLLSGGRTLRACIGRYCTKSNPPEKGSKAVGYWLLGCTGMVFVAVVLGGTGLYAFLVHCVCVVMEEIVKRTGRQ